MPIRCISLSRWTGGVVPSTGVRSRFLWFSGGLSLFSDRIPLHCLQVEMNPSKRSNHGIDKDNAETSKDILITSGQIQPLKIPDAVVALAQAAAKANCETEKYLAGWPLFLPPKLQMDKCTKCSREFCSSINYRRHTRIHRRTLKLDKDFPKNREHVAAFWDKLAVDEAKTILSFTDVIIEGVTGSSILTALTAWMCKPGYASLPVAYARAGSDLLDLIQTKASLQIRVPSDELFSVLDKASENTFLCTNVTANIQKFLFGGEVHKIATELKNVVACASYMLEKKLVEAWCADKVTEALRCQKLLVEEEEAAQKRQAELMERKRLKKLRQKEQRLKDFRDDVATAYSSESMDDASDFSVIQSKAISDPILYEKEDSQYPQFQEQNDYSLVMDQSVEDDSCDSGQVISRTENLAQNSSFSSNVCVLANKNNIWEWNMPVKFEEEHKKYEVDVDDEQSKNSRVLIGSISVAIDGASEPSQEFEHPMHGRTPTLKNVNDSVAKVIKPFIHEKSRNNGNIMLAVEKHSSSSVPTDENNISDSCITDLAGYRYLQCTTFSGEEATSFLSQRWKDAISGDHVKLVLCPEK